MQLKSIRWFLLSNFAFGIVLARQGMLGDDTDGELPRLKPPQGVEREPEDGVINEDDIKNGINVECKLTEETGSDVKKENGKTVKDTEWKWVRLEISDTDNTDTEIPLEGQVKSKLDAEGIKAAVNGVSGWIRLKCSLGNNFAEFRVDAGEKTKGPKLPFRVHIEDADKIKVGKSHNVVEKEDLFVYCKVVNRTLLSPNESVEEGIKRIREELNVTWYRWSEPEDQSYVPEVTDVPVKPNCTSESMEGTKWELLKTSGEPDEIEPHIKMISKDEQKEWGFKIENAVDDDRRGYKCVVYNISQPANCSEAIFFLRVKDKYAALWPFIGIVAEVVVLCIIIFVCEHNRNSKNEFEDEGINGNGVGMGGGQQSVPGENSSIRHRRQ